MMLKWSEIFYYQDGKLYWLKSGSGRILNKEVGHVTVKGYRTVKIKNKNYQVHRIIWEMFNNPIPDGFEIDHINRNRDDNKLENLRLCTRSQQISNTGLFKTNQTGFRGVSWREDTQKYRSLIYFNGKGIHLGYFKDIKEAGLAYNQKARELFGEFAYQNDIW